MPPTQTDGTQRAAETGAEARDFYLDLLKGVLTRAIFEEVTTPLRPAGRWRATAYGALRRFVLDPRHLVLLRRGTVARELREDGRDHPPDAETMVGLRRLDNLQHCVEQVLADGVPGDLLEAGVWRGGSAIFMQAVLRAHGASARRVWVCDSFAGLPPPNAEAFPADAGDTLWAQDHLAVPEKQVRANFARYGLLDDNVVFLKGLFQDTFPTAEIGRLAVLRADGDMYESTIAILEYLYPKVSPGGFVIVDDYGCIPACRAAVDDYRRRHGIDEPIEAIDWTGVFWRRAR